MCMGVLLVGEPCPWRGPRLESVPRLQLLYARGLGDAEGVDDVEDSEERSKVSCNNYSVILCYSALTTII